MPKTGESSDPWAELRDILEDTAHSSGSIAVESDLVTEEAWLIAALAGITPTTGIQRSTSDLPSVTKRSRAAVRRR